jgi:hypothetical protein
MHRRVLRDRATVRPSPRRVRMQVAALFLAMSFVLSNSVSPDSSMGQLAIFVGNALYLGVLGLQVRPRIVSVVDIATSSAAAAAAAVAAAGCCCCRCDCRCCCCRCCFCKWWNRNRGSHAPSTAQVLTGLGGKVSEMRMTYFLSALLFGIYMVAARAHMRRVSCHSCVNTDALLDTDGRVIRGDLHRSQRGLQRRVLAARDPDGSECESIKPNQICFKKAIKSICALLSGMFRT